MIKIVTDSTCDIPDDLRDTYDITSVPALLHIGQETLRDGIDMTREAFYNLLPELPALPTTSAPGPGAFMDVYERALNRASHVVSVHAASKLSGIYNAARLAAKQLAPDRIHLIDTGTLSMGVGWTAIAAAEAAARNETVEGVIDAARDVISRMKVYALLNTVEYLARSGRINMVQAGLTNLLNIKPIVELTDGAITSAARIRTWSRAVRTLSDRVHDLAPVERIAVMHSNCLECAHDFVDRVKDIIPASTEPLITSTTTAIGTHAGPHALGVAAITRR